MDEEKIREYMSACRLCPRECGADRLHGKKGYCRMGSVPAAARASLHMWEEPCITGEGGSGTVFFTGCSLGCLYCQNMEIARGERGIEVTEAELADIFLRLQDRGAENINLVTAAHFVPQVCAALAAAKDGGLTVPIVYNTSGYEKADTLKLLEGLVDVWLTDFRYMDPDTAGRWSNAPDYPEAAKTALEEMMRQTPAPVFDRRGIMRKGVIVRILLLPGHVMEAKQIAAYVYDRWGDNVYISLLSQYTPMEECRSDPLLGRRVTKREYERLTSYAADLGISRGFVQEGESAKESFIPAFDGEGILPAAAPDSP